MEIIKRSQQAKGIVLLAKRWVVERTFGWLINRDHKRNSCHHESLVYLAMINLNLRARTRL